MGEKYLFFPILKNKPSFEPLFRHNIVASFILQYTATILYTFKYTWEGGAKIYKKIEITHKLRTTYQLQSLKNKNNKTSVFVQLWIQFSILLLRTHTLRIKQIAVVKFWHRLLPFKLEEKLRSVAARDKSRLWDIF